MLIDLHCHLLPGIDDGSNNMETSLRLAREAVANGVTHALLTPHHMNGVYINHKADVLREFAEFQQALDDAGIELTVFPGQEVRINGDLLTALDDDDILFADEDNKYMLLEFPDDDVPTYTTDMVYKLQMHGIVPIIVHPERNTKIMRHPEIFFELLKKGCLSQITASSYVGTFGEKVEIFSRQLIEVGQCYIFASDTHDLPGRKYEMREAFEKLAKEFDEDLVREFKENAKFIVNGDEVVPHAVQSIQIKQKKKKFFGLF